MDASRVTIVVPTRDRARLASRAIASALGQTLKDLEVVVVDDGSGEAFIPPTDDPRVRVIRHERPLGACAARNRGLEAARGRWIVFLDDDDELLPSMLEVSLRAAEESTLPAPVAVLSGIEEIDTKGQVKAARFPVTMPRGRHYFLEGADEGTFRTHNTLLVPAEVIRSIGGWDEQLRAWQHGDLFLRLNAVCSLQGVPVVTYKMTDHDGPRVHTDPLACAEAMKRTEQKHRRVFLLHTDRHAHYLGAMGIMYLKAGRWGSAVAATTRAVLRDPRQTRLMAMWLASLGGPRLLSLYRRGRKRLETSTLPRRISVACLKAGGRGARSRGDDSQRVS